jgi:hypothetical protein
VPVRTHTKNRRSSHPDFGPLKPVRTGMNRRTSAGFGKPDRFKKTQKKKIFLFSSVFLLFFRIAFSFYELLRNRTYRTHEMSLPFSNNSFFFLFEFLSLFVNNYIICIFCKQHRTINWQFRESYDL